MKKIVSISLGLVLVAAAFPVFAGDEKVRCESDITTCTEAMAAKYRNRGWVGITMDYNKDKGDGVVLTGVIEDGPAEAAGLDKGDILRGVNGIAYSEGNEEAIYAQYEKFKPGDTITYEIERDGKTMEVDVTLGKLPSNVLAQWIGYHVMEAHLAEHDEGGQTGEDESGD